MLNRKNLNTMEKDGGEAQAPPGSQPEGVSLPAFSQAACTTIWWNLEDQAGDQTLDSRATIWWNLEDQTGDQTLDSRAHRNAE